MLEKSIKKGGKMKIKVWVKVSIRWKERFYGKIIKFLGRIILKLEKTLKLKKINVENVYPWKVTDLKYSESVIPV